MEPVAETYIDKSTWYRGPWDHEPDRIEWRHTGRPCLVVRGPQGALCGYVAVDPGHPCHGKDAFDIDRNFDVESHGGLTYSARCQAGGKICHVAQAGEPDDVWWLGFDCSHDHDYSGMQMTPDNPLVEKMPILARPPNSAERYCDVAYVRAIVNCMAESLNRIGT